MVLPRAPTHWLPCRRWGLTPEAAMALTTKQRGYGWTHVKTRAWWKPQVERGEIDCWRCGKPILPGTKWELGHSDVDRSVTMGPEHFICNRSSAGKRGRAKQLAARNYRPRRPTTIDRWS